ncbi:MAG TPA: hypothetical protein VIL95_08070 [Bacillota bacterium]
MPTTTSFDAIWRALEDTVDGAADGKFEVTDHALWVDALRGDRKYELRLAFGDFVSATIALEQDPLNAAVDEGSLDPSEATPGGCSLFVEFCVLRDAYPHEEFSILRHVIEEFWPDVEIAYTRLEERASGDHGGETSVHEHFSFVRPVNLEFTERIQAFLEAVSQTLQQLAAIAER